MPALFRWLLAGLVLTAPAAARAADPVLSVRVVIDSGHDPVNPGAVGPRGTLEQALNDILAARVREQLLAYPDIEVILSRAPEEMMGLPERARRIAALKPDLVLSLHHDSVKPQFLDHWIFDDLVMPYCDAFRGFSVFAQARRARHRISQRLAGAVADNLMALGIPFTTYHAMKIPGERRRWLDASRGIYAGEWLYLLRTLKAPAVLVEAGFIIHRDEELRLGDPAYVERLAEALSNAVVAVARGEPPGNRVSVTAVSQP